VDNFKVILRRGGIIPNIVMSESLSSEGFIDRSDPRYLEGLLIKHFSEIDHPLMCIYSGPKPPESFEELKLITDKMRTNDCPVSDAIDGFVDIIGSLPDRDRITRLLPYSPEDGTITLIIPGQ
jgi:hypothetical protein